MNTLIVFSYACRESAVKVCNNSKNALFVLEADFPFGEMTRNNMTIASYDTFLGLSAFECADDWISQYWDKSLVDAEGSDLTEWNGTSLKSGINGLMIHPVYKTIREVIVATKVLDLVKPVCIHCGIGVSINYKIWEKLAEERGVAFKKLVPSEEKGNVPTFVDSGINVNKNSRYSKLVAQRLFEKFSWKTKRLQEKLFENKSNKIGNRKQISIYVASKPEKEMNKLGLDAEKMRRDGFEVITTNSNEIEAIRDDVSRKIRNAVECQYPQRWSRLAEAASKLPWLYYEDVFLWDFLEDYYREIFKTDLPYLAIESDVSKEVFKRYRPASVICKIIYHGSVPVWLENAKKSNIKTIALQREQLVVGANEGFPGIMADIVLTQGPSSDEFIVQHRGAKQVKTIQYGCKTRVGLIKYKEKYSPDKVRKKYNIKGDKVVLYADGHYCGTSLRENPLRLVKGLQSIIECSLQFPSIQFLIKMHPGGKANHNEHRDYYDRRLDVGNGIIPSNLIWLPIDSKLDELLSLSPIILSVYSTVGVEAMRAKLPSVFIFPKEDGNELPDFEEPLPSAIVAHIENEIPSIISCLASDRKGITRKISKGQDAYWSNIFARYIDPVNILVDELKQS